MTEGLTDAQIIERLQRLERNVQRLAEQAGVELEDPARGLDPEVVELARTGRRMEAAVLLAERTGTDFPSAQRTVADL
jgi:hypothetical protein